MSRVIPEMVLQSEINECGLACIAMLADTQGVSVTLPQLRDAYPVSVHGTSLDTLATILSDYAIPVYPVLFSSDEIQDLPLPAILHYGAGHYVVLVYRKGERVCVMNPAIGQQFLTFDALKKDISGYALILDEDAEPKERESASDTAMPNKSFLSCLSLKQTSKIKGIYFLMILAFLVSLTLFIMPAMVGQAINDVLSAAGKEDFPYLLFFLAFIISTALALWVRSVTEQCVKRFAVLNSTAGFSRLLSNSLRFYERRAPGEVFSRFSAWETAALQKIELDNGLRTDWIIGLLAFIVMAYMSFSLALVSLAGVTLMGLVSIWAIYRDRFYAQQMQERIAEQNEYILESIQGFTTIKSAGLQEQRKGGFARYTLVLFNCIQKKHIYEQVKNTIYQMVGSLEMVLFMFLALPLLKNGVISLGSFFAYSFIRQIFSSYITKIFFAVLQKNQLHIIDQRAADLFPEATEHDLTPKPQVSGSLSFCGQLKFDNITFSYDITKPTLHCMSFSVEQGHKVAIVGESGAGKSTLIKIIAGLLVPDEGQICLQGREITSHQIGKLCFLQSQEDILFNTSVLENITLFDPHYDDSQQNRISVLLEGLNLTDVIAQLPGGMNARIREGHSGLSLGQRQRLLLARAMYSSRPVLVLDEPMANLDDETACRVMMAVMTHCREQGKTLIVVTHSKTILGQFDDVYHLDHGHLLPPDSAVMQGCVA